MTVPASPSLGTPSPGMGLYEVTNGHLGDGPVTAFAWAGDSETALEMARERFRHQAQWTYAFLGGQWVAVPRRPPYPPAYWERLTVRFLFRADAPPFCTEPAEGGWEFGEG